VVSGLRFPGDSANDEPGRDVQPGGVDDLSASGGGNIRRHPRNARAADGDIHDAVDVVRRIDHMAALDQQIVARKQTNYE